MDDPQLLRYSRQILLKDIDTVGQERLRQSRVLIVGAGGLGNPVATLLAGIGIGRLTIVDDDHIDATNLGRQLLFRESDVGHMKVEIAAERLSQLNPEIDIQPITLRADYDFLIKAVADHDIVIDATDHFSVRDTINSVCWQARRPWVFGAAVGWSGQTSTFDFRLARPAADPAHMAAQDASGDVPAPQLHGCYRCLYGHAEQDEDTNTCVTTGVIATTTHLIATLQVNDAVRILLGHSSTQADRLNVIDLQQGTFRHFKRRQDPDCPICGPGDTFV